MPRPRLPEIALLFFRVGNTTFGGGDPAIAALQREFDRREWITSDRFSVAYGLARITPGTNMLAFCAAAGWYLAGVAGAVAAVLVVTIPSAALVVWLTNLCEMGERNPLARAMVSATIAAAVGLMLATVWLLVRPRVRRNDWIWPLLCVVVAFALARFLGLSPMQVIGLAAIAGFVWPRP